MGLRLPRPRRRRGPEDGAATEVLGFVLMFALSSIVLVTSVQTFSTAQDSADGIVGTVELRGAANRVSTRIVQSALLAADFPNATMEITLHVPKAVSVGSYWIDTVETAGGEKAVRAESTDGTYGANASIFNVDKIGIELRQAKMYSSNQSLVVAVFPGDRLWDHTAGADVTANTTIQLKGIH